MRASLNPDPNHFVLKYLNRYIDDKGFAIKEYSGKPAYFVFDKGQVITSWSYEDLIEQFPVTIKYPKVIHLSLQACLITNI